MQFMDKLAAKSAQQFKDTADTMWESLGGSEASQSKTVKAAKFSAGKYAVLATVVCMMNFPDNAALFSHGFNVTGNGPSGVQGFAASKSVTANKIARTLANAQAISQTLALEATKMQGGADVFATSTLGDVSKMMPILVASPKTPEKTKGTK